jgi:hypothetical protein
MITEKDFAEAISEYFDEGERTVPEYKGKTEAQVMFELAKKMAIEFAEWIKNKKYIIAYTKADGDIVWLGLSDGNSVQEHTSEQLFELYQQSK